MSNKFKVLLLTATSGLILQIGCWGGGSSQWLRWLGDLAGDSVWLRGID